jgi:hypothetical protein
MFCGKRGFVIIRFIENAMLFNEATELLAWTFRYVIAMIMALGTVSLHSESRSCNMHGLVATAPQ